MRKRALILANQHHDDERFAELPGASADAEHLHAVLSDPGIGQFEVDVLSNETARTWQKEIQRFFSTAERDDILLLHLSCHGRKDTRNRLHFIARDSEFDMLEATSVSAEFLADRMEQSRSWRTVLLLDCCYSGAFAKGMRSRGEPDVDLSEAFQGNGRIVITSSTSLQYSYESEALSRRRDQPSVFTSAIVEGLRTGDADGDQDGYVSVDDLYRFVLRRVTEQVPDQTPTLSVISVDGQIRLARSPKADATRDATSATAKIQQLLIPPALPNIPGLRIAHRYLPGSPEELAGGDWFDVAQLPGSRTALVIGDAMGLHGIHGAARAARFRAAALALVTLDLPPAQILRHLDNLSHKLGDDSLLTCLVALYDPINRTCEIASAGHVPPVLVHPDGRAELLELHSGAPLGVGGVPFDSATVGIADGSVLALFTDGLVERPEASLEASLRALCDQLIDPKQSPEAVCDTVLDRLDSTGPKDDIALLVAALDGMPDAAVATWTLSVDITEVHRARTLVQEQLISWGLAAVAETAELLVGELVANAVHATAHGPIQLQLIRTDRLLAEVSDDNHNLPSPDVTTDRTSGLGLVARLCDRWGTARKAVGKVVWFELQIPR
ncbi:SpoIIE family protein phosphatase [Kitasatospora sp. NPDC058478]|uniref:caspase, EACC1-associated type n=1 Tax=unclassified Kitasatospora TaxID=2633591 RepID=UPI0036653FDB